MDIRRVVVGTTKKKVVDAKPNRVGLTFQNIGTNGNYISISIVSELTVHAFRLYPFAWIQLLKSDGDETEGFFYAKADANENLNIIETFRKPRRF